jgi:hypothetical protein
VSIWDLLYDNQVSTKSQSLIYERERERVQW